MFENAKEYLARVVPWPSPGEAGFVNFHWTFPPPNPRPDGKPAWTGRAVTSMAGAEQALKFALKDGSNTLDVYACMSSQLAADPKTTKGKKPFTYNSPIRLASNAMLLKSFFLDLDYGKPDGSSYATPEEAIIALNKFRVAVGLPKPTMVVSTGGGFHVYWCVSSALTPFEWAPISNALAEAARQHGLKCDTQCTVDSVRVLRIPDTFNRKKDPARHVAFIGPRLDYDYIIDRVRDPLAPYVGRLPTAASTAFTVDATLFPRHQPITVVSALGSGLDDLYPTPDLDLVSRSCGFLRDALATGGAGLGNPLWNLTTLISTFTKGKLQDAHRLGDKHVTYKKEDTDDLFARKNRERIERGIGWPSCTAIATSGSKACGSCPHAAQGKSPLNFELQVPQSTSSGVSAALPNGGQTVQQANGATSSTTFNAGAFGAAQAAAPVPLTAASLGGVTSQGNSDMPQGYFRDTKNVINKIIPDPANPQQQIGMPICDYPMMDAWVQRDPRVLHFRTQVEQGANLSQIDLDTGMIGGTEMRKTLQEQGLMLKGKDQYVGDFMSSWVKELQLKKGTVASAPFGWQNTNGQIEGFIYGGRLWTPSGNSPAASANMVLNNQYKPKGSDVYWMDAVKLVALHGRPDLEAILASAFAAPLVMFTGHLGMLMSAYSKESGIGKTTAQIAAQAVWGDPVTGRQSLNDTQNSVVGKIGNLRSLPIYWDELHTDEDTKRFVNLTFQVTGGKEKSRLNRSAEQREPGQWQTMVVSCGNDSLVDHVTQHTTTTLAGFYRIFEFKVAPVPDNHPSKIDTSVATIKSAKLNNNYGQVGERYATWLGANFKQIEADMAALSAQLNKETSAKQEERFWISLIACILLGAGYASTIGYSVFNVPELKNFMLVQLDNMRKLQGQQTVDLTKNVNITSVMAAFTKDMQKENRVIHTDRIHIAPGRPPRAGSPNAVKVLWPSDISRLNGVAVQIGRNDRLMRISYAAFSEWLKKQGKPRHVFVDALKAAVTTTSVTGYVASGTSLASFAENIIQLDLNSSNDFNFIDEIQ